MSEIESLKKEFEKIKNKNEVEIANLKINYIASIIVVLAYLFFMQLGELNVFGIIISPTIAIIAISIITLAFFIKEAIIYAKFLSKKILKIKS